MPTSHVTIHIMKVPKWSTMRVHDVACNLPSTVSVMKPISSSQRALIKKIAGLSRDHECGMLNLECA
jgi:hypothetical protein